MIVLYYLAEVTLELDQTDYDFHSYQNFLSSREERFKSVTDS